MRRRTRRDRLLKRDVRSSPSAGCRRAAALLAGSLIALAGAAPGSQALAQDAMVAPAEHLTPHEVVTIQLDALKRNDEPHAGAGIEQVWLLAHPANKAATGPLERFARMLRGPHFRAMLNHRAHDIEEIARSADRVAFLVVVQAASGGAYGYEWIVERVAAGPEAGCWMTTAVSPPTALGPVI